MSSALHYFVAVAQERNFTRAAERLHVAQPALSRQVRLLEQELGVELLYRTTHEFELTKGKAVVITGESTAALGLPEELCWLPLTPSTRVEVALLARCHNRSPAVDRMLEAATGIADALGWI